MSAVARATLGACLLLFASAAAAAADASAESWRRAMELSDAQRYDEALGVLREALAHDPTSTDLRWLEAGVLGWSGRHAESVARFESLIADRPDLADDVRLELATQRLWSGDPQGALGDAEAELAADPSSARARRLRALALAHAEQHERAIAAWDELLAETPDDLDAALDRAMVLGWSGKNARAVEAYEALLVEHPDEPRVRIGLAQNENWRGNHDRASALFEEVLAEDPTNPDALRGLAYASYWADRPEAARAALDRFTAVRPEDGETRQLARDLRFEEDPTLSAGFETSDDSDDQRIDTLTLDYRLPLRRQFSLLLLARADDVEDPGGTEEPLRIGAGVEKRWGGRWKAGARLYHFDPRHDGDGKRGLGQAALAYRPGGRLEANLGFEVEPVLTRRSLELGIRATGLGASLSFRPVDRVRLTAGAQLRDYSDGNDATLASAGVRWAVPSQGRSRFTLLFGADLLRSDEDLDNGYYDPERYVEFGPGAEWAIELQNRMTFGLRAQTGYQQEKGSGAELFYKAAAVAALPLGRAMRLGAEIGRSSSSLTSESGFELTRASIYLTRAF